MSSFLQFNTIFISILIEAIPFVLIGVFLAGAIQMFVTEEMISKIIPKNKFLAVLFGTVVGALFPACECGIVPIVRKLINKGVPVPASIAFMLTGPLINPVVLFSTYVAFGNNWNMAFNRAFLAFIIALTVGTILALFLKNKDVVRISDNEKTKAELPQMSLKQKCGGMLRHSLDEFFDIGKFLLMGAAVSSAVLVWVPTDSLAAIGKQEWSSILTMMGLSYLLSLCSEADAFIAASFKNAFMPSSLIAFLVYGGMIDLKNTFMMASAFKLSFVIKLLILITVSVFLGALLIGG